VSVSLAHFPDLDKEGLGVSSRSRLRATDSFSAIAQ